MLLGTYHVTPHFVYDLSLFPDETELYCMDLKEAQVSDIVSVLIQ